MNNFHYHQDPLYAAASSILGGTPSLNEGVEDVKAIIDTLKVGDLTNFGKVLEIGPNSITFKAKDLPKTTIAFNQRKMGSSEFLLLKTIKLKEETELEGAESLEEETDYTRFKQLATLGLVDSGELPKIITAMKAVEAGKEISAAQKDLITSTFMALIGVVTGDTSTLNKLKQSLKGVTEAYKPLRKPADLIDELQSIVDAPDSKLWDVTSVSIRLSHEDIFDRFPKIYDYVEDMWFEIMQPNGAKKTKEIAKKAIEAVRKYYPIKEEESIEEVYVALTPKTLIDELQSIIDAPSEKIRDSTSISIRLSWEDIFHKFKKIWPYVQQMRDAAREPNGGKKAQEIAKQAIADVKKYYPIKESAEEEILDEAFNWLGDGLATSEESQFGGYRPKIIDKKTKKVMYLSAVRYKTPQEAKDHAEDYLKQKAKGIRDPKVPVVGTFKESDCSDEKMDEAADAALKRRKQVDMARVNAGTMSRDDYNKKYKLGKYRTGSSLAGPGGLYKNLVKEEETLEEARNNPETEYLLKIIDDFDKKEFKDILNELSTWMQNKTRGSINQVQQAFKEIAALLQTAAKSVDRIDASVFSESIESEDETLEEASTAKVKHLFGKYGFINSLTRKEFKNFLSGFADYVENKIGNTSGSTKQALKDISTRLKLSSKLIDKTTAIFFSESTTVEGESLEEAVPTPAVQKLITSIDMLSPKEYLVFLQALASNAQGVSNMSRPVNALGMPDKNTSGASNAKAWAAVADHISAAADAYAKRPVRLESTTVEGESLEEGAADKNNEKLFDLGKKLGLNDSQITKLIVGSLKAHNNPLKAKENLTFALDSTLSANSAKQKALLKFADAGDYESLYNAIFESAEVQGESLEEAANIKPVQGKYIFFIQDRELYQLDPYKLVAKTDFDKISNSKLMSHMKLGSDWKTVSVAWGTDLIEIGALESPKDISDAEQWYVVPHLYDKVTHLALVH
jgi:hypothetical protein